MRAFLDFKGLSYDVVEVNSMTKKELDWSTYKKVPILVLKSKKGYQVWSIVITCKMVEYIFVMYHFVVCTIYTL